MLADSDAMIERFIDTLEPYISWHCYSIESLADIAVSLQIVESVAERFTTFFIEYPRVTFVDVVAVDLHQILNSNVFGEFLFWEATHLKEVCSKPNFFYVCLVVVLCSNLFYSELLLGFFVFA